MAEHDCDERAARNVVAFLRDQEAATGVVPSDRALVVERFRDEIGDWRLCLLSPFGGRVHAPWALALGALLRREHGLEAQSVWSDDGIILHLPDSDAPPDPELVRSTPSRSRTCVVGELGGSALYGARFRENAARALLIPRRRPGQRTPLWQQRLKAQSLLQVAERYGIVPDRARDVPRAPAGPLRPARAARLLAAVQTPRDLAGRGRDRGRLAVRPVARLRLRRALRCTRMTRPPRSAACRR